MSSSSNPGDKRFLMWGQLKPFNLSAITGTPAATFATQLIKVNERVPNVWNVYLWVSLDSSNVVPGTGEVLDINFTLNYGVGEAQITRPFNFEFGLAAGLVLPAFADSDGTESSNGAAIFAGTGVAFPPRLVIPAQSINIGVTLTGFAAGRNVTYVGNVGAFVAPRFSPISLDTLMGGSQTEQARWMGHGFHDEPLGYRR
jgi:hypothetical protein